MPKVRRPIKTDDPLVIDSKSVVKSIIKSRQLEDVEADIAKRRDEMNVEGATLKIRDYLHEIVRDDDLKEVIAVKSMEKSFIKSIYEKTDFNKLEIMYVFAIPHRTFNGWIKDEKWRKLNIKKSYDQKGFIGLLYAGEYNLIHVKKETAQNLKNKYNSIYYKLTEMSTKVLEDAVPDNNLINALHKVMSIVNNGYEKQLDIRGISGNAKDRKMIELKEQELILEERKVKALEDANHIQIVSNDKLEEDSYNGHDMYSFMEKWLSRRVQDEELRNEILKDAREDFNISEDEVEEDTIELID